MERNALLGPKSGFREQDNAHKKAEATTIIAAGYRFVFYSLPAESRVPLIKIMTLENERRFQARFFSLGLLLQNPHL